MRLLECRPDGGFAVTGNLPDNEDLEYAILSHRWGSEEAFFEDLVNGTGGDKDGYEKLKFCAEQARHNGLRYFWVDTCCINKFNNLELSKAINSMFRWYKKATKCYVFLSDVSVPDPADVVRQDTWAVSFKESEWFTRGWTLQELIAPESVEFFSSEGHLLGDKTSLGHLICDKTGIPAEVLQNRASDYFSVPDVKEWSRTRETTEPEDKIYCLLGILNIFMAPSYGEGIDNATKRLDDELKMAGTKTTFIVPYARNGNFVGYERQLAELEQMIRAGQQATKIAITGPGGIGKSQLALELAYRTREEHKNCAVFWISATDMDSFSQACSYIAQRLAIPGWDNEKEDARRLLQLHLGASAGKWLLIYDDADDASLGVSEESSPQATALLDFMPRSDQGTVIFTTAMSDTAKILAPENTMELPQMTAETAEKILDSRLPTHNIDAGEGSRKALLEELSYLPLAITQAAAYIERNEISISSYLDLLSEQKRKTTNPSDGQPEQLQNNAAHWAVAITTRISLQGVSREDSVAADCLFFMACVDRKDVLLDLLPTTPSSPIKKTVKLLSKYAILIRRPESLAVELHRLVHLTIRNYLREQGWFHQRNQEAVDILAGKFPSASHGNRNKWRRLLPHAKYALADSSVDQGSDSTISLAIKYAIALYEDGRFDEAEDLFVQVMETRKRVLGDEHPSTLTSMANLASTYRNQGRWKEAEDLEVQVMETSSRVLGDEHPDTLTTMNNLAFTLNSQGRSEDAIAILKKCCSLQTRVLGAEHPHTISSLSTLRDWQGE